MLPIYKRLCIYTVKTRKISEYQNNPYFKISKSKSNIKPKSKYKNIKQHHITKKCIETKSL